MTVTDGRTTVESEAGTSRAEQHQPGDGQSIISSIRSPLGSPRSGADVRPNDLVTLPGGMVTTVAAAQAAGFLTKDMAGNWSEVGKSAPSSQQSQAPQEQQQAPQEQKTEDQPKAVTEPVPALDEVSETIMDGLVLNSAIIPGWIAFLTRGRLMRT